MNINDKNCLNERYSLIELSNGEKFLDATVLEHIYNDGKIERIKIAYKSENCFYRIIYIKLSAIIKTIPFATRKACQVKVNNRTYTINLSDEEIEFNINQGIQVV